MRKSSVCFLHFLHPSFMPDCSMCLKGKSFPNPSSLKYHQMEQKETELAPEAFPPWNVLDAPAPELWLQSLSSKMSMPSVEGWIREHPMPRALQGTILQSRTHPTMWWCGDSCANTSSQTSFLFSVPAYPFPSRGAPYLWLGKFNSLQTALKPRTFLGQGGVVLQSQRSSMLILFTAQPHKLLHAGDWLHPSMVSLPGVLRSSWSWDSRHAMKDSALAPVPK